MNCLMPFYKCIFSSFYFILLFLFFPLVVLQHLGCVGRRAFEEDMEKEGTPHTERSSSGVVFVRPSFPSFPRTSAQTACESVTVQGMIQTQVRKKKKKVKYLVHSCSVFIFIVVQGSRPSFPPRLFWLWHTRTHPSPHTLPHRHTHTHTLFLFVGYNGRHQAFGSLILKTTI